VVIVVCHGGVEYIPYPPPYFTQALQRIAEAGADLIIGHHPHVPQGIQIHNNVPICYSLGNFVFFQPTDLLYRKIGYLLKAGVSTGGLSSIRLIPYEILSDRLSMLSDQALTHTLNSLAALSKPFLEKNGIQRAWHGFLKYYGVHGFKTEITGILDRFDRDAPKGAAMFRNRLTTLQHSHHLVDLMTRIMNRTLDDAPEWAVAAVAEYFSRKVADGLPEKPWS
jgi:poly-gamma-glutamate synthesis protein (capsule biosynthesis protein)